MSQLEPGTGDHLPPGEPSPFGCPECGGVLWEVGEDGSFRFRCRVGHAYSTRALMTAGVARLDDALWAALRALEEQESLARRMLLHGSAGTAEPTRQRLEERMHAAHQRADVLREFLLQAADDGEAGDWLPEPGPERRGQLAG